MDISKLVDAFLSGVNLDGLVKISSILLKCPILILDDAFHVISYYKPEGFHDIPFDSTTKSKHITYEVVRNLNWQPNLKKSVFLTIKESPWRRRVSTLRAEHKNIGYLFCVDIEGQLEQVNDNDMNKIEMILAKQYLAQIENTILSKNTEEEIQREILRLSVKDLAFYGLLRVRFFAALGLILALNDKIRDVFKIIFDNEAYFDELLQKNAESVAGNITALFIIIGIFMILVVIGSIIFTIVKYYNFLLTTKNHNLLCKYGLLTKKSLVIDIDRIQSVKLIYPLRYRIFGLAKLSVETLTNNVSEDLSEQKSTIDVLPLVKKDFAQNFVENNLGIDLEYYDSLESEKIQRKARIAMYRWSLFNCSFLPIILFAILYFANVDLKLEYKVLSSIAFYLVLASYSILVKNYMLKYNELSYDKHFFKNTFMRQLTIITEFIKVKKVGTINSRTNYFMNKRNLSHLSINSIGVNSDIKLKYYDKGYKEKLERDFIISEVGYE